MSEMTRYVSKGVQNPYSLIHFYNVDHTVLYDHLLNPCNVTFDKLALW